MFYVRLFVCFLLLHACAIQSSPDGGPKDETPPEIVTASPPNKSTNFKATQIVLEFDEYIQLKNFSNQFFSSPPLENNIKPRLKGKKLYLDLDEELRPNTTYTFSFGTALQDITENNIQANYKYVFSTGNVLDSLVISGKTTDAYTGLPIAGAVASLYPINLPDSSLINTKPSYYSITDDAGSFTIENLAVDTFRLVVIEDVNLNLTYEPAAEKAGFSSTPVISGNALPQPIRMYREKAPTKFLEATQVGYGHLRISFTNPVDSVRIQVAGSAVFVRKKAFEFLAPEGNGDTLNYWYNPEVYPEDMSFFFLNIMADTLKIDSVRVLLRQQKAPNFEWSLGNSYSLSPFDTLTLSTKVPILSIEKNLLAVFEDSVTIPFELMQRDLNQVHVLFKKKAGKKYRVLVEDSFATDLFNRPSDSTLIQTTIATEAEKAILKVRMFALEPTQKIFELINDKNELVKRQRFTDSLVFTMPFVEPGKYGVRVIWDYNKNNLWDGGDFRERRQPEPVIYYPKPIELRANWELEVDWEIPKRLD